MKELENRPAGYGWSLGVALITLVKGGLIGIANIIPGVSGGTFALILGVFDRLVGAINSIGLGTVKAVLGLITGLMRKDARARFRDEMARIDALFLILIMLGALATILSSSFLIEYLLSEHYSPTLAFFVGLIVPSIAVPWAMMDRRGVRLLLVVPGAALTVGVSLAMPDNTAGTDNLLAAAGTGAIAISAMILPGISGSFIMLVMGQYQNVLTKVTGLQSSLAAGHIDWNAALWLGALALGMALGLLAFAKLLNFLLKRAKASTMAFLIGLLLGSLWVLWPFKDLTAGAEVTGRDGEVKQDVQIATAPNRLPQNGSEGLVAGGAFAAGLVGSIGLIALGKRRRREEGEDDSAD